MKGKKMKHPFIYIFWLPTSTMFKNLANVDFGGKGGGERQFSQNID